MPSLEDSYDLKRRIKLQFKDNYLFTSGVGIYPKNTFKKYNHLDRVLPAMGYGKSQMDELVETINKVECDVVISATPIDLARLLKTNKKILRVTYDLEEIGNPDLNEVLKRFQ